MTAATVVRRAGKTGEGNPIILTLKGSRTMNHQIRRKSLQLRGEIGILEIKRGHRASACASLDPTTRGDDVEPGLLRQAPADSRAEVTQAANDNDAHDST
jgi:hypothetical protein